MTSVLSSNVKTLLKARKMQQKDLAEKMGMKPAYLSTLLAPTGNPTLETLQKMATALNVPVSTLLKERESITGYVEVNGKGYRINSWNDIVEILTFYQQKNR